MAEKYESTAAVGREKEAELKKEPESAVKEGESTAAVGGEKEAELKKDPESAVKEGESTAAVGGEKEAELKKDPESAVKEGESTAAVGGKKEAELKKDPESAVKEGESTAAVGGENEAELKKELESAVKTMLEEDDYGIEKTVQAIKILTRLTEMRLKKSASLGVDDSILSDTFKCPISGQIMGDPVILASGQTYDRPYIENWLNQGNLTCFQSNQVLSHSFLTPNCLVRDFISRWYGVRGVAVTEPRQHSGGEFITGRRQALLNSLLEKLSSSLSDQKEAAKELRRVTEEMPSHRVVFCELPDAISRLLSPLSESKVELHPDLQEDLITTVLNISTHVMNKKMVGEHPVVVPLLTESMKFGTMETRRNAAAALFALSAVDSNKVIIGKSMASAALLELLQGGHPSAMKEAASTIFNLCMMHDNKRKFIEIGAVKVIMQKINDSNGTILVEDLVDILALLSTHTIAIDQLSEFNTIHCLIRVIRNSNSSRTKENCVVLLFSVCSGRYALLKELWVEEVQERTLAELADTGTERAKKKAMGLITKMENTFPITRGD